MSARTDEKNDALRITNQFRSKGGMAYDMRCDGVRLTLLVTARTGADDPGEWHVEARAGRSADRMAVVSAWGPTRADALHAVGESWPTELETADLRVFDWEAIAKALSSVRAI